MGRTTYIQWCDTTVNATSGCDGCELWKFLESLQRFGGPCYAGNLHEGRLSKAMPNLYAADFTEVRLIPGRMAKAAAYSDLTGTERPDKPWLNGLPRVIFVGDMGDLFSKDVPFEFIRDEVIRIATGKNGRRHIWMLLTKQPSRAAKFWHWLEEAGIAWPENVWIGTSVTTQATLSRAKALKFMPATVRFLSLEPQWEPIDIEPTLDGSIHLVIQGGESDQRGHEAHRFELDWARAARNSCRRAKVAYLLKQLGSRCIDERNGIAGHTLRVSPEYAGLISRRLKDSHGGDMDEWPEDLRVREFPKPRILQPA